MSQPSLPAMKSVIKWGNAICKDDGFSKEILATAFDDHSKQIGTDDLLTALEAMVAWSKDPRSACPLQQAQEAIARTKAY